MTPRYIYHHCLSNNRSRSPWSCNRRSGSYYSTTDPSLEEEACRQQGKPHRKENPERKEGKAEQERQEKKEPEKTEEN
jgi:hypothetical protein